MEKFNSKPPLKAKMIKFGKLCKVQGGFAFKSTWYKGDGIPLVRISSLVNGIVKFDEKTVFLDPSLLKEYPDFTLRKGDTLVAMSGATTGKMAVYSDNQEALLNQRVGRFKLLPELPVDPKYISYLVNQIRDRVLKDAYGAAQPNISPKQIEEIEVPYFPLKEQQQIVAEIEKQFSRLDEAVASLKRIQANLKRYKAAVLKAAVEGKLTEQWRKDHPEVEHADQLLKRILAERRSKWEKSVGAKQGLSASPSFGDVGNNGGNCIKGEAGESFASPLPQTKSKGIKSKNDSWKKKYKEPAGPAMANLPELPEGWVWATYGQTGTLNLGRQRAPKYHTGSNMRQYLRVQNVFEDRIDLSDVMEMDFPPADFEKYELKSGDMLLNEGQSPELLGRPAIYRGELPGACFTNTLIRFRAVTGVSVEFALLVSRYYMRARRFLEEGTITTNIAHLSLGRLATIEFPLPCFAEQQTIVAEAERLISVSEEIEVTIKTNLKRAERLRQTILQKAFSGGLVS